MGHFHFILVTGLAFFVTSLSQPRRDDTGLPFVYAVWVIRRDQCLLGLGRKLLQAMQDGLANLDEIIATHPTRRDHAPDPRPCGHFLMSFKEDISKEF